MDLRAAHRYAQALFEAATMADQIDVVASDLESIATTLHESRELRALLATPVVKPDAKHRVLGEIFAKQVSKLTMSFIELLVRKHRENLLGATASEFRNLLDTSRGVVSAGIRSAVELGENEKKQIADKLSAMIGRKVTPSFSIDTSIRGGFVARIGDTLIDASLRHQLEMLREQFRQGGSPQLN